MSNYSDASIVMYPSSRKTSEIYSQKPVDDSGNLVFSCNTARDEINSLGVSTEVAVNIPRYDYGEDYVFPVDNSFYTFDASTGKIVIPNYIFGSGNFTITREIMTTDLSSVVLLDEGLNNSVIFRINTNGKLRIGKTAVGDLAESTTVLTALTKYTVAYVKEGSVGTYYVNGVAGGTTTDNFDYSGVNDELGRTTLMIERYYEALNYNLALTPQVILDNYNGLPIPDKYKGANNSTILSGTFNVGKQYRILVPGTTDFTLIGASDSVIGTEFTATGIGTGTGTATSIGNTLDMSAGKTLGNWYDLEHGVSGVVTDAVLNNSTDFGNNFNGVSTCPSLLLEPSFTNYFLNSRTPVTQTVSGLSIGTEYTINCKNAGIIVAVEPGGAGQGGTITEVYSFKYIATQTSILLTLSAGNSFEFVQLSNTDSAMNHVETLGVSVTKALDTASKTGLSSYIDSVSGSLKLEIAALSDNSTTRTISLSDGTTNNRVYISYSSVSNQIQFVVIVGGVVVYSHNETVADITLSYACRINWASANFSAVINDVVKNTQLSGSTFSIGVLTRLGFDTGSGAGNFFGRLKSLEEI